MANLRMGILGVDSRSGSEDEFFDCLGELPSPSHFHIAHIVVCVHVHMSVSLYYVFQPLEDNFVLFNCSFSLSLFLVSITNNSHNNLKQFSCLHFSFFLFPLCLCVLFMLCVSRVCECGVFSSNPR